MGSLGGPLRTPGAMDPGLWGPIGQGTHWPRTQGIWGPGAPGPQGTRGQGPIFFIVFASSSAVGNQLLALDVSSQCTLLDPI